MRAVQVPASAGDAYYWRLLIKFAAGRGHQDLLRRDLTNPISPRCDSAEEACIWHGLTGHDREAKCVLCDAIEVGNAPPAPLHKGS